MFFQSLKRTLLKYLSRRSLIHRKESACGKNNMCTKPKRLSKKILSNFFYSWVSRGRLFSLSWLFFGILHSDGNIFPFLLCFSLLFFSQLFCKASPDSHFAFLHFFSMGMVLIPVYVEAETPILWPPHLKSWLIGKDSNAGKDWGQEEKGTTEDEMAGWHHRLDGHGFG